MEGLWSVLPIILEVAIPTLVVRIGWGVRALAKKWGAEEQINVDDLIDQIVRRAVDGIEQLSEAAKKRGEEAIASGDKLAAAIVLVKNELEYFRLPIIAGNLLKMRIEACLRELERSKGD
jgi:hypothetical protein